MRAELDICWGCGGRISIILQFSIFFIIKSKTCEEAGTGLITKGKQQQKQTTDDPDTRISGKEFEISILNRDRWEK